VPTPATVAALPPEESAGRGAPVAFTEYEAENGETTGMAIGPDRTFGTLAAEASGRRAVRLEREGDAVAFTLAEPADGLTVRYAVPDSPDGRGLDTQLGIYAGERRIGSLPLTSRYAWFYGRYPFTNRPADGRAHHFYDHVRLRLPELLPAGTRVSLRREAGDKAAWEVIDLADFERVPPPRAAPPDAVPVVAFGADPSGQHNSAIAFRRAIEEGRRIGKPVWIQPGTYRIDGHLTVDAATLAGAGQWHSVLRGRGIGLYGKRAPGGSNAVVLRDFALIGEVAERDDKAQLAGIGGALSNSRIERLWIQHHKVGMWFDGPMEGLTIRGVTILDETADGINFHRGVTRSSVEDSFIRNTGDDGLAMWSRQDENAGNAFRGNTVIAPVLANGIALYGGRDLEVRDNLVADTLTQGGGIHLGARFGATPFGGAIRIEGNMVARGGSMDPNWKFGVGALWFHALEAPIAAQVTVRDLRLIDSNEEAIQFLGANAISGITLDQVAIRGAGGAAFQLQAPGSADAREVTAEGLAGVGVLDDSLGFALADDGGNSGWLGRAQMQRRELPAPR